MERAAERRRAAAWDEPPGFYDGETIADAAFRVTRDTGIGFDAACDICRTVATAATHDGIAFDAAMLADVVTDTSPGPVWEDQGITSGVHTWRLPLAEPHGRRRFVRVYLLPDGVVHAETRSGYVRVCATVEVAKAFLEG